MAEVIVIFFTRFHREEYITWFDNSAAPPPSPFAAADGGLYVYRGDSNEFRLYQRNKLDSQQVARAVSQRLRTDFASAKLNQLRVLIHDPVVREAVAALLPESKVAYFTTEDQVLYTSCIHTMIRQAYQGLAYTEKREELLRRKFDAFDPLLLCNKLLNKASDKESIYSDKLLPESIRQLFQHNELSQRIQKVFEEFCLDARLYQQESYKQYNNRLENLRQSLHHLIQTSR